MLTQVQRLLSNVILHRLVLVLAIHSLAEIAQGQSAPTPPTATRQQVAADTVKPASGTVDVVRSRVYIKVDKKGLGHVHGVVGKLAGGQILLGQPQQAGAIKFDLRTFTADTLEARRYVGLDSETDKDTQQKVNHNMHGEHVLNVKAFPEAIFTILSAQRLPGSDNQKGTHDIEGDLTLHGVKRPVRFHAQAEIAEGMILLRGNFSLTQSEFGMKPYTAALGAVGVADKLHVWGDIWIQP